MDDRFLINLEIAGKYYPLTIKREEEELIRAAAKQLNWKIIQDRQHFSESVSITDLLAMVAVHLSYNNLQLEREKDTYPILEKMQQLTAEVEHYLEERK